MPELPEVETIRRSLEKAVQGEKITAVALRRRDLRIPFPEGLAAALAGKRVMTIRRRAKYLLFSLEGGLVMLLHLGMSGRLMVIPHDAPLEKHDHLVIGFTSGKRLVFRDPRRFGLVALSRESELEHHPLLAELGPEPFSRVFSARYLAKTLAGRGIAVKQALMDAGVVAGVGNIYACEALFEAGMDPRTPAAKASEEAVALVKAVRKVLNAALASGGSSLRDFFHANGDQGYFQHCFHVYGREGKPCRHCTASIRRIRQAGRSTFFCPRCQR